MDANTTQITITKTAGIGILTKANDGRWDIVLNGQRGGSAYYSQDQVERIVDREIAAGSTVECK